MDSNVIKGTNDDVLTNPLGKAKIEELLKKNKFVNTNPDKITLTEDDYHRAICTHRCHHDESYLEPSSDDNVRCTICNSTFRIDFSTLEEVEDLTAAMINIFHTLKLKWVNVPDKVAVELFQALAIIEKLPKMYEISCKAYEDYINNNSQDGYFNSQFMNQYPALNYGYYKDQQINPQPLYYYGQPRPAAPYVPYFNEKRNMPRDCRGRFTSL